VFIAAFFEAQSDPFVPMNFDSLGHLPLSKGRTMTESPEGMPSAKCQRNRNELMFFLFYDCHCRDVQLNVPTNFAGLLSLVGMTFRVQVDKENM
jgi:hypothetical protein